MRTYPVPNFKPGDRISYSIQFLKSIGEGPTSPLAHARGRILEIEDLGGLKLAKLDWAPDFPERVNVFNLALVGPNPRHCNID